VIVHRLETLVQKKKTLFVFGAAGKLSIALHAPDREGCSDTAGDPRARIDW
jgi:hypothetical protein